MTYYVYMLRLQNGSIYVGSTNNLDRRYQEHLDGTGSKATAKSKPIEIIYTEEHSTRSSAIRRELQLKKWTRAKKLALAQGNDKHLHQHAKRKTDPATNPEPALNVVVYRNPGPDDRSIESHAHTVVQSRSARAPSGGLGYVTLMESDFDRLWDGVDQGDALGTAYSVLPLLGPGAEQFIGREDDFMFGWIGGGDQEYGNVLLLQIIPRPHLLAELN